MKRRRSRLERLALLFIAALHRERGLPYRPTNEIRRRAIGEIFAERRRQRREDGR